MKINNNTQIEIEVKISGYDNKFGIRLEAEHDSVDKLKELVEQLNDFASLMKIHLCQIHYYGKINLDIPECLKDKDFVDFSDKYC